ncbi:MAG: PGF-pre-PGF domain-containing protein [Methanosarcinales archaeon]|nr:PGF-pre-PGF domain-containing protein [ANME-2 cluster archaeon]MDW7775089.1 PGF-pre-PGF domain-containing protein [Methanosarcinales archaeon]
MTRTDSKVNEMLDNPLFRNTVHLIGTLCIGYILLRILLSILDVTKIGIGWLEAHQDGGMFIIILILILSFLAIDAGISLGRRRLGDEKYSVVESVISLVRAVTRESPELPELPDLSLKVNGKTGTGIPRAERPSGVPDGLEFKGPVIRERQIKKPAPISGLNQKPEPALKKYETRHAPVMEPTRHEAEKHLSFDDIISELNAGEKHEVKPEPVLSTVSASAPVLKEKQAIPEKPVLLDGFIKKPVPDKEPESNIMFYESVPILVKEGKRVIKAFDSKHSINVIDFRSKISKKDVKITIELLKEHSVKAGPITEGLVYEFDNIGLNIHDEAVDKAVIRFKIDREWITQNKIRNVQLELFVNGKWDIITIKGIGQDAMYLFFEASVPSLSVPIAIVGT